MGVARAVFSETVIQLQLQPRGAWGREKVREKECDAGD